MPPSRPEPYREWAAALPGAVLWTRRAPGEVGSSGAEPSRVLPDGCLDLIAGPDGLVVAGPDTTAHLVPPAPGETWVGLRLPPGTGPAVLGVPGYELRDRRVPLADLWGAGAVRRIEDRLATRSATGGRVAATAAVLDAVARQRFAEACTATGRTRPRPDPVIAEVVERLRRGSAVAVAADAVGLGARQLHRRSLIAFGYGPKTLARILRLTRALDLVRAGIPPARVAAEAGYADQPHLAREVRELTGVPLGTLLPASGRPA